MVFYIDSKVLIMNLTKRQMRQLKAYITMHMQDAFKHCEPTKEMIKLYDKYSIDLTYQEEVDNANEVDKESFLEILKAQFGIDIDPNELDKPDEEGMAKLKEILDKHFKEQKEASEKKPKNKKQIEKEARQKLVEEIRNTSIREIYIALAKVLHPDTSSDESDKKLKEEIMKKVVKAYEDKDLYLLMKLEMDYMEKDQILNTNIDKIKIYTSILKDQLKTLRIKQEMQVYDPRYIHIMEFNTGHKESSVYRFNMFKKDLLEYKQLDMEAMAAVQKLPNPRKIANTWTSFVNHETCGLVKTVCPEINLKPK